MSPSHLESPTDSLEQRLESNVEFLSRLARSLVSESGEAADLVQDTLTAALVQRPVVHSTRGWLVTVLRRKAARFHARNSMRQSTHRGVAVPERVESHVGSIDARLDAIEILTDRLKSLSREQRRVVVMRYSDGFSPTEIAGQLGLPLGTVKTRLKRAIARLRSGMAEAYGGEENRWIAGMALLAPGAAVSTEAAKPAAFGWGAWAAASAVIAFGGYGVIRVLGSERPPGGDREVAFLGANGEEVPDPIQAAMAVPSPVQPRERLSGTGAPELDGGNGAHAASPPLDSSDSDPEPNAGRTGGGPGRAPLTLSMEIPDGVPRSLMKLELRNGASLTLAGRAQFSSPGLPVRDVEFRGKRSSSTLIVWVPALSKVEIAGSFDGFEPVAMSLNSEGAGKTFHRAVDLMPLAQSMDLTLELPRQASGEVHPNGELWYVRLEYDAPGQMEMPMRSAFSDGGKLAIGRVPSGRCRILGKNTRPLRPNHDMEPQGWNQLFEAQLDLEPGAVEWVPVPMVDTGTIRLDVRDPDGASLPASFYLTRHGDPKELRPGIVRGSMRASAARLDGKGPALLWPLWWPPGPMCVHVSMEGFRPVSLDVVVESRQVSEATVVLSPL